MAIVDPEPWFRRVRDIRLRELRDQLAVANTREERRTLRIEMRRAHRDYQRAMLQRYLARW